MSETSNWVPTRDRLDSDPEAKLLLRENESGTKEYRIDTSHAVENERVSVDALYKQGNPQAVRALAEEKGIFRPEDEEYHSTATISRSDFLFSIWYKLGCPKVVEETLDPVILAQLDALAGKDSFYRDALGYLLSSNSGEDGFSSLYNWRDIEEPITWIEVGYLLFEVFGVEKGIDWNQSSDKLRLCILQDAKTKSVLTNLLEYKGSEIIGTYILSMRSGRRAIPLFLLSAFRDLGSRGWGLKVEEDDGNLFKEVTRAQADMVVTKVLG